MSSWFTSLIAIIRAGKAFISSFWCHAILRPTGLCQSHSSLQRFDRFPCVFISLALYLVKLVIREEEMKEVREGRILWKLHAKEAPDYLWSWALGRQWSQQLRHLLRFLLRYFSLHRSCHLPLRFFLNRLFLHLHRYPTRQKCASIFVRLQTQF